MAPFAMPRRSSPLSKLDLDQLIYGWYTCIPQPGLLDWWRKKAVFAFIFALKHVSEIHLVDRLALRAEFNGPAPREDTTMIWNGKCLRPWFISLGLVGLSALFAQSAAGADGAELVQQECAQCHAISKPEHITVERVRTLEAPDLFYAGNKFRAGWLEKWLQAPAHIRPAGTFFGRFVVAGEERDIVDTAKLPEHPAYSAEEAEAATTYLMSLRPHDDLVAAVAYQPGSISRALGKMNFEKFKGCIACHESKPGFGGLSGPELYTAFQRVTPEYLFSFIKNPHAWAPKTFMPSGHLNDAEVAKLVDYLKVLGED